jgi:hypothetical protein
MTTEIVRNTQLNAPSYLKARADLADIFLQLPQFTGVSLAQLLSMLPPTLRRCVPPPSSPEQTLLSRATAIAMLRFIQTKG